MAWYCGLENRLQYLPFLSELLYHHFDKVGWPVISVTFLTVKSCVPMILNQKRRKICVVLRVLLAIRHYFSNFAAEFATIYIIKCRIKTDYVYTRKR